ncbi:4920_t:CDS:1 [Ambispora leptoticha]|uniref:4920_t:CDS:1 n=1 Tax=Ambispora leptoticha TaxID=144679 RepID=A0A9N9A4E0_9GLOM|nr:4920_t:CDS:1 [Ambispora leptoticha]
MAKSRFDISNPKISANKLVQEYISKEGCHNAPNAFIIYRILLTKELHAAGRNLQAADISQLASENWDKVDKKVYQDASESIRRHAKKNTKTKVRNFSIMTPDFFKKPIKKSKKPRREGSEPKPREEGTPSNIEGITSNILHNDQWFENDPLAFKTDF